MRHSIGLSGEGIASAVKGNPVLLRGERLEFGGASLQRVSFPIELSLTVDGGLVGDTGTVQVEMSPYNQETTTTTNGTATSTAVLGYNAGPGGGVINNISFPVTAGVSTVLGAGVTATLQYQNKAGTWATVPGQPAVGSQSATAPGSWAITSAAGTIVNQAVQVSGAVAYRWSFTGGTTGAVYLSDWVVWGTQHNPATYGTSFPIPGVVWNWTLNAQGRAAYIGTGAPMAGRMHSNYDYVRLNCTAYSSTGGTIRSWVKRNDD